MSENELFIRNGTLSDAELLFEWVNEPSVRKNAFHMDSISYEEHIAWYKEILNNPNSAQYILMSNEKPIGQVRLSIKGIEAEIDYSVDVRFRGSGYGQEILRLIKIKVKEDFPSVKRLIGKVKPSNVSSYYCFIKSGFEEKYRKLEFELENDIDE